MYEFNLTFSTVAVGVYLDAARPEEERRAGSDSRWSPRSCSTSGLAVTVLYTASDQLVPALHSYWLWIHVSTAIFCGAVFYVGAVATILYLFRDRYEAKLDRGRSGRARSRPPSWSGCPAAASLDKFAYRVNAAVFPLWTFTIIAGAIWAGDAWGRYWGWDPKEVWSFITWVAYACYLHARATAGWKGRKAAYSGADRVRLLAVQLLRREHLRQRQALLRGRLDLCGDDTGAMTESLGYGTSAFEGRRPGCSTTSSICHTPWTRSGRPVATPGELSGWLAAADVLEPRLDGAVTLRWLNDRATRGAQRDRHGLGPRGSAETPRPARPHPLPPGTARARTARSSGHQRVPRQRDAAPGLPRRLAQRTSSPSPDALDGSSQGTGRPASEEQVRRS